MEQERGHNPEKEKEEARMKLFRVAEGRLEGAWPEIYEEENQDFVSTRNKVVRYFFDRLTVASPEHKDEMKNLLNSLDLESLKTAEEVIAKTADITSRFLSEHYTLKELNDRIQEGQKERGYTVLNDLLVFDRHEEVLALHVTAQVDPDFARMLRLTREGFQKLAKMLSDDSQYADVEKITAESWIVARSPEWMKKLGFTVTGIDENKKIGYAEISAEELISRYGKK